MFRKRGWNLISAARTLSGFGFHPSAQERTRGRELDLGAGERDRASLTRILRYPGEDDVYEKPILDQLGL